MTRPLSSISVCQRLAQFCRVEAQLTLSTIKHNFVHKWNKTMTWLYHRRGRMQLTFFNRSESNTSHRFQYIWSFKKRLARAQFGAQFRADLGGGGRDRVNLRSVRLKRKNVWESNRIPGRHDRSVPARVLLRTCEFPHRAYMLNLKLDIEEK